MQTKPNRPMAVLSYLIPVLGAIVVIGLDRRNLYALYHACQALMVGALFVLLPIGWLLVSWAIGWVPMAGPTLGASAFTIVMAGVFTAVILSIVGIANAASGKMSPLFLVGRRGERLFVRLFPEPVVESRL